MAVENNSACCCCFCYDITGQTLGTAVVVQERRPTGTLGESRDHFEPQFPLTFSSKVRA